MFVPPNQQVVEKLSRREDGQLDVVHVWHTIQGEGPFAGLPAVFVRLAGCNLQCPLCDTDYTSFRRLLPVEELVQAVLGVCPSNTRLVVITGGEPFRQPLGPFVQELLHLGLGVQVETNGTIYQDDLPYYAENFTIVCSPKTPHIDDRLKPHIRCLKYVLDADNVEPSDGLPKTTLGNTCGVAKPWPGFRGEVLVHPADPGGDLKWEYDVAYQANVQAAIQSCKKFGYRFGIQLHKIVGLP